MFNLFYFVRYMEVVGYIYIFFITYAKLKLIYFRQPPCRFTVRIRVSQELSGSRSQGNYRNSCQDSGFCRSCSAARIATRIANTNLVRYFTDNIYESKITDMKFEYTTTNRQYLVDQIEEELGMTIDSWEWSDREIQDMYDSLIGSMYNGITWEL